jgi:signal transduction histidine kinase
LQQKETDPSPPAWVRIDEVVRQCAVQLMALHPIEADQLQMQVEPCEVLAHKVDIEILVRNLMDNAIKYAGSPPCVEVELRSSAGRAMLAVSDNGPGIPRHLRRKIFNRFYRAGNELERTKSGTGLGLFLVRSIVQRLKGTVRVADIAKSSGSKFVVVLPGARIAATATSD